MVADDTPPELLAQIVNVVVVRLLCGIPLNTPFRKMIPSGNSGSNSRFQGCRLEHQGDE